MKEVIQSVLLILVIPLPSCGDVVDYEHSSRRSLFTFHNEAYQGPILASAIDPLLPGVHHTIRTNVVSGRYCLFFEDNQGLKSSAPAWSDGIDLRLESWRYAGLNNGPIMGYGNLNSPSLFYVYDLQYPDCFNTNTLPLHSYELEISSDGFGTCSGCHRKCNLNTGENIISGDSGKRLIRYRVNSADPYSVLGVN